MKIGLVLFVALAGILNTLQSGSNTTLNKTFDRPLRAVVCVPSVYARDGAPGGAALG